MMLNKRAHDMRLFIKICEIVKIREHITEQGQITIGTLSSQLS